MRKILFIIFMITTFTTESTLAVEVDQTQPYERFIGLGMNCMTRWQINIHLPKRFGLHPESFGGGQVFDWMLIHDYNKLAEAFENDLNDLLERDDLESMPCWDAWYVRNTKYNMTWNHLFTPGPPNTLCNTLDLEYPDRKQKIDHLVDKFKNLKEYRTLYIVAYPFIGPNGYGWGSDEPDFYTILNLRNAIAKIRGNDNFSLLYCPVIQSFEEYENIYVRTIEFIPPGAWMGNAKTWDAILSEFPFTLETK